MHLTHIGFPLFSPRFVPPGMRDQELEYRKREDELFRQSMRVHQETVDTYLEDIILDSVDACSDAKARAAVRDYASKINRVVDDVERNRCRL